MKKRKKKKRRKEEEEEDTLYLCHSLWLGELIHS